MFFNSRLYRSLAPLTGLPATTELPLSPQPAFGSAVFWNGNDYVVRIFGDTHVWLLMGITDHPSRISNEQQPFPLALSRQLPAAARIALLANLTCKQILAYHLP